MKNSLPKLKTKRILVDGFNLIYKFEHLHGKMLKSQLESAITGLTDILVHYAKLSGKKVSIVYDGKKREGLSINHETKDSVEVYYSIDRTADQVIVEMMKADKHSGDVTVVTSDKQLLSFVKRQKCYTIRSEEFEQIVQEAKLDEQRKNSENKLDHSDEALSEDEVTFWASFFSKTR